MASIEERRADTQWITEIANQVAANIVALRKARGWKTGRLATEAQLNYTSLKAWENGDSPPNLAALLKLTAVFDLASIEELLDGHPIMSELQRAASRGTSRLLERRRELLELADSDQD